MKQEGVCRVMKQQLMSGLPESEGLEAMQEGSQGSKDMQIGRQQMEPVKSDGGLEVDGKALKMSERRRNGVVWTICTLDLYSELLTPHTHSGAMLVFVHDE